MKKSEIKIKAFEYLQNELKNVKCKLELDFDEINLVEEVINDIDHHFIYKIDKLKQLLNHNTKSKPVYEYKEGVIEEFYGRSLSDRQYYCRIPEEPYTRNVKVLGGVFTQATAPKIGDTVKIRCRITKSGGMNWWWCNAKICEIIKSKES